MIDVAPIEAFAADVNELLSGLLFGGEQEQVSVDAVFGVGSEEILAHVLDHVAVGVVVSQFDGNGVIVFGMAFIRGEGVVIDVSAFEEEAAAEVEDLLVGAGGGWGDAVVGDLLAMDGVAAPGGDGGVLDVHVAGALGLGLILQLRDPGHDGIGGGMRSGRAEGGAERSTDQGSRQGTDWGAWKREGERQAAKGSPVRDHTAHYGRRLRLVPIVLVGGGLRVPGRDGGE